jgi:hypothetical protein
MNDASKPHFWRLGWLRRSFAFGSSAIAADPHDEIPFLLFNFELYRKQIGDILADHPQNSGIMISRLPRFQIS